MLKLVILLGLATFVSTSLGGLLALRFKDKLHLILGFSAGAVMAVSFFDLMPESILLISPTYSIVTATTLIALGFVIYLILDRAISLHLHEESSKGNLRAGSLALHSFLDGFGIGVGFKVSVAIGMIIATAVLVHDFSDGINTVSLVIKNGGTKKQAFKWLVIDAVAPIIGISSTFLFSLSETTLGIVLALFCGFFLYIGASDLLPESHHAHPKKITTMMTVLGMFVLYVAIKMAG